ncbi:hypothetical protein D046_5802B, partial [Vibrio parahaemolyticus V-223/04]
KLNAISGVRATIDIDERTKFFEIFIKRKLHDCPLNKQVHD